MNIRPGTDQDIPAIVSLLKRSLGESLMPKSEAFWRWKHIDNPFGKSLVLLAFDGDQLIGVRAFMKWEWQQGNKTYKAVRAVDTATHPDHQGKGIFKTLTLQLVEQCKDEGVDFIFNTPNTSSKPGYLKMGWMSNGKMKIYIKPFFALRKKDPDFDSGYGINSSKDFLLDEFIDSGSTLMITRMTERFLRWRYAGNPNVQYYAFSGDRKSPYLTIFRLKKNKFVTEFRICESFHANHTDSRVYRKHLRQVVRSSGANLITSTIPTHSIPTIALPIGPEITTRPLSFDHNFLTFNFWKPSLGDMEVF